MKGQGYRHWYLTAGVLAAGALAFGVIAQWAPARDGAPKTENPKPWFSEGERQQASQAVMESVQAKGLPPVEQDSIHQAERKIDVPTTQIPGWVTTERGQVVRWVSRVDATPVDGGSGLATGGATGPGGACTCDSQCMAAAGECRVAHCVGGQCVQENAPTDTRCNADGMTPLFCTDDRCNELGVCIDTRTRPGDPARISPCSNQCCSNATCALGSFQNCFEASDCPGTEGCFPKRQLSGGVTYVATCDETNDRCFVATTLAPAVAVGRCCTGGVCTSGVTQATCGAGLWIRWQDPDDVLHACNATLGCPKYSSGIAPDGPHITAVGPVVPPPSRCSIHKNICETTADCITVCNGGPNVNEACDFDSDCTPGLCLPLDVCTPDPTECPVPPAFTSVGDDYSLSNGQYLRLSEFRFRGGSREPAEMVQFEFYDSSFNPPRFVDSFVTRLRNPGDFDYRFIVDCSPNCDTSQPAGSFGEEQPADPPFIIPPNGYVVMRATRLGAVFAPFSRQFGEDDGNLFWYSTDVVDVGSNNPNQMWINGAVVNHTTAVDVLSFELLGEKLPSAPLAACCDPDTGACQNKLPWDCQFCIPGPRTACTRGRDCGLNNAFRCSDRDWKGARTRTQINNNAFKQCAGRYCFNPANPDPQALTPCTGMGQGDCPTGQTCEAPCEFAACCTPTGCVDVTSAGQCSGLGGTLLGFGQKCTPNCCPQPPTGYDCCKDYYSCHLGGVDQFVQCSFRCSNNPSRQCTQNYECEAPGTCNIMAGTQADCVAGQVCNKVCSGPTGPADPKIHKIDVPDFGDPAVISDFASTTAAVFSDDCALGGADKGWYEMFTIGKVDPTDKCATVTINLCCSDPLQPGDGAVNRGCPCAGSELIFADRNASGQQFGFGSACNNDFCCSDGNFSIKFTLKPGTYIYTMFTDRVCATAGGTCESDDDCPMGTWCRLDDPSYNGHIIVEACPPGACCGADQGLRCTLSGQVCTDDDDCLPAEVHGSCAQGCTETDIFTCQEERKFCKSNRAPCTTAAQCPMGDVCLPGTFLGNKLVTPVPFCSGGACNLGACCIGPGNCQDNNGGGISFAACSSQGAYVGGFRCNENPCPVCPIETTDQCQSRETSQFIHPSDRLVGTRRADDFRPTSNLIKRVCWYPCFIGVTSDPNGFECSAPGTTPPDAFIGKIYADDGTGKPGALVAGVPPAGLPLVPEAKAREADNSRCWRYTAPINPPTGISVVPGECYWLEITGLGESPTPGTSCIIHWVDTKEGNNYSMRDVNNVYENSDYVSLDLSWCLDCGIEVETAPPDSDDGGCGNFPVACCKPGSPDPVCIDGGTYQQCVGTASTPLAGVPFPFVMCADIGGNAGCPKPPNDACADAIMPPQCMNQTSNPNLGVCSVSDGPPNIMEVCDTTMGSPPAHDCPNPSATCGPRPPNTDAYRCTFQTDNRLAGTDGPTTSGTACSTSGTNSFQADIWYKYTAPCDGFMTIHNCGSLKTYDSMLQLFASNSSLSCVNCPVTANTDSRGCSDDNCGSSSSGSALRIAVVKDRCYTIRMGGWSQLGSPSDAGQNISGLDIGVVCNEVIPANPPAAATGTSACAKNKYISFAPNNPGQNVAFRVQKAALAGGATNGVCVGTTGSTGVACTGAAAVGAPVQNQGTCPAMQLCIRPYTTSPAGSCWVQAPVTVGGGVVPQEFWSKCDSTPVFRVWGEAHINVGDCEVIPAMQYTVHTNIPGPVEVPTGLSVNTITLPNKYWGDVVGASVVGGLWPCPQGVVNAADVSAVASIPNNTGTKPPFTYANLVGAGVGPCLNSLVNASDVQAVVLGAQGNTYSSPSTPSQPADPSLCAPCP